MEPINGEELWDQLEEIGPLPPLIRKALGRPKKNRNKKVDLIVEARARDSTMLKRKGSSLQCENCQQYGHNSRTCKNPVSVFLCSLNKFNDCNYVIIVSHLLPHPFGDDTEVELGYEAENVLNLNVKKHLKCNYCKKEGHNARTRSSKVSLWLFSESTNFKLVLTWVCLNLFSES